VKQFRILDNLIGYMKLLSHLSLNTQKRVWLCVLSNFSC